MLAAPARSVLASTPCRARGLRSVTLGIVALAAFLAASGCLDMTSEATFIGGRSEVICDGTWPVCKGKYAGCVLEEERYLTGTFPGTRKFIVRTIPGDYSIRVMLFLNVRLSPGTETEILWYEPGCAEEYRYQISQDKLAGDLFEQAGRSQVFAKERSVVDSGDHLVEVYSDATCRYDLRMALVKKE